VAPAGTQAKVKIGDAEISSIPAAGLDAAAPSPRRPNSPLLFSRTLKDHNYPVSEKTVPVKNPDGTAARNDDR